MAQLSWKMEWVVMCGLAWTLGACSGDDSAGSDSTTDSTTGGETATTTTTGTTTNSSVGVTETDGGSGSATSDSSSSTTDGETDSATASTTDSTTDTTTDSATDSTTGTTTDTTTDSSGSTTAADPLCGDGVLDEGEECDDGNDDNEDECLDTCVAASCGDGYVQFEVEACDDGNADETDECTSLCAPPACDDALLSGDESDVDCGGSCDPCDLGGACLGSDDCGEGVCSDGACSILASCKAIIEADPGAQSGMYTIDVDGDADIEPFEVYCDMETDGGGWTELTPMIACTNLSAVMDYDVQAPTEGIDAECRPYTRDAAGAHSYHYTIPFPAGFSEFYLNEYVMKANASGGGNTSDIYTSWSQSVWTNAYQGSTGDISFGSAAEAGPVTSYGATLNMNIDCVNCEVAWPEGMTTYQTGMASTEFRIGWGEAGSQAEGWFPWWSGTIRVR